MADEKEISARLGEIEKLLKKSPTPRDSVREMIEDGFGVLTPNGQRALALIRGRYTGDFKDFFTTLSQRYDKTKRATAEIKRVSGVLSKINSLVELIDQILLSTDALQAKEDGIRLAEMAVDLDSEFEFFTDASNITQTLSENLEDVADKSGVSLEDIKAAQAVFTRKTQEITKQPTKISRIKGGLKSIGQTALSVATLDLFGGGQAVRDSAARRELRKQRMENIELGSAATNVGREATEPEMEPEQEDESSRISKRSPSGDLSGALFSFFNTGAYRAKWTSQLLASSGYNRYADDSGSQSNKMGMGLGGMTLAALVPQIMKIMGPAMAIMFAGQVGWLMGRAIGQFKLGEKTVDKHIEDFGTRRIFGGDEQMRTEKAAKKAKKEGLQPLQVRALELQAENPEMTPGEAAKQAWAELHPETPEKAETPTEMPLGEQALSVTPYIVPAGIDLNPETGKYETTINGQRVVADTPQELEEMQTQFASGIGAGDYSSDFSKDFKSAFDKSMEMQEVPIDISSVEAQKAQQAGMEKLDKSINEMKEVIREGSKGTQSKPAGYDANNIRNPLLSSMGAGQLTN